MKPKRVENHTTRFSIRCFCFLKTYEWRTIQSENVQENSELKRENRLRCEPETGTVLWEQRHAPVKVTRYDEDLSFDNGTI